MTMQGMGQLKKQNPHIKEKQLDSVRSEKLASDWMTDSDPWYGTESGVFCYRYRQSGSKMR